MLGGQGVVVIIDELLIAKRKYNVGHVVEHRWVFGLYDTELKAGYLKAVEDRSRDTLLPIIQEHVLPVTEIHSDQWRAYVNVIGALPMIPPYIHFTVNHGQNIVDPVTVTHTNNVECMWKNCKRKFKAMYGTNDILLDSYLKEFMWRQYNGKMTISAFENILLHISQYYPV